MQPRLGKRVTADNNISGPRVTANTAPQRPHPHDTHPRPAVVLTTLHPPSANTSKTRTLDTSCGPHYATPAEAKTCRIITSKTTCVQDKHIIIQAKQAVFSVSIQIQSQHPPDTINFPYKWTLKGFHSQERKNNNLHNEITIAGYYKWRDLRVPNHGTHNLIQ